MKKQIHEGHRKRMKETYLKYGLDAFSDVEKIEFLLFFSIARKDTNPIAHTLLSKYGSLSRVLEAPVDELKRVEGLGESSAMLLSAILPFASACKSIRTRSKINGTSSAKAFAKSLFDSVNVEEFYIVCLAADNTILNTSLIGKGSKNEVPVNIADITRTAQSVGSERIILMHNHPIGLAKPSDEDLAFTVKIILACILNNIEILDHIIISPKEEMSLEESGVLSSLKSNAGDRVPGIKESLSKFLTSSANYVVGK